MIFTSAPLAMASTTGSVEVPARSIAPDAEARRDTTLEPLHETHHQDAHRRDDDDRDEHAVDTENVLVRDDQIAETDEADEEFRDDHADEAAADRQTDSCQDIRHGRRQDHVGPQTPLAGVEGTGHLQQLAVDVPDTLLRIDEDREDREERDR